jgi:hypothetical protein
MSLRDERSEPNLLSEFALTIVSSLGLSLPVALVIIWICS